METGPVTSALGRTRPGEADRQFERMKRAARAVRIRRARLDLARILHRQHRRGASAKARGSPRRDR
ncbi:MAG: hypothetical protein P0Y64_15495 [Candidatus Sphingomonas colombiensis]|nr:hypothetical protein [Sphingomonas sp.]WEK42750.1 MAG: hypothetical protein P0Y64_15495 [Sphingomonas sp.]